MATFTVISVQRECFKTTYNDRIIAIKAWILVLMSIRAISPVNLTKHHQISKSVQMSFYYSPLRCIYPRRSKSHWESSCCWTRSCASVTVLPSRRSCPGRWSLASYWCLSSTCLGKKKTVLWKTTPKFDTPGQQTFLTSTLNLSEQMRCMEVGDQSLSAAAVLLLSTMLIKVGYLHIIFL